MQFGATLPCLLQCLVYCNQQWVSPLMDKLDLLDGLYCIPLSLKAALELAIALPGDWPHPYLVGIPPRPAMGWAHSPLCFCAYTPVARTPFRTAYASHPG
jgi:hypothetical protein